MEPLFRLVPSRFLKKAKIDTLIRDSHHNVIDKLKVVGSKRSTGVHTQTGDEGVPTSEQEHQLWRELIDKVAPKHLPNAGHLAEHLVKQLPNERDKQWEILTFCLANTDTRPNKWMADAIDSLIPYKKYIAAKKQKYFSKRQVKILRNSSPDQQYLQIPPLTRFQQAEIRSKHRRRSRKQ